MPRLLKSELLGAIIARLSDPGRWTRGASARTASGAVADYRDPNAVSWCLTGAMGCELVQRGFRSDRFTDGLIRELCAAFHEQYPDAIASDYLPTYNDMVVANHGEMMAVLEKVQTRLVERGE